MKFICLIGAEQMIERVDPASPPFADRRMLWGGGKTIVSLTG